MPLHPSRDPKRVLDCPVPGFTGPEMRSPRVGSRIASASASFRARRAGQESSSLRVRMPSPAFWPQASILAYLPTYLPSYLPTFLPSYLPTFLPSYLPTYYLSTISTKCLPSCLLVWLLACLLACLLVCLLFYIPIPTCLRMHGSGEAQIRSTPDALVRERGRELLV